MARFTRTSVLVALTLGSAAVVAGACGGNGDTGGTSSSTTGSGGKTTSNGSAGAGGAGGTLFTTSSGQTGPFADFPSAPILDGSAPADSVTLFGPAGSGDPSGGPCLFEPESGALFPRNWLRPRFRWSAAPNHNLFEIRLHTDAEINDLVVYTTATSWTMPKDMWTALALHAVDVPITMTVRGAEVQNGAIVGVPSVGTSGPMTIAPADASGAIVYWTTSSGSALKGFVAGDEAVSPALQPSQVTMKTVNNNTVTCIGCHTSTPDGSYAGFTAQGPWGNALASVEQATVGATPPFLGAGALAALQQNGDLGIQTYSKAHYQPGDRVMITPWGSYQNAKLAWVDLEATQSGMGSAYGFLQRNGDARGVGAPTWSHDGKTVVYVSTNAEFTGRLDNGEADLYAVPYNDRQGGDAAPIAGAADPDLEEYYPAFSPDDALLTFNRIPKNTNMYNAAQAEVFVIPSGGGAAARLNANDPPACTNRKSPGVTNSWPKWSPDTTTVSGKKYYWLIFSSTRSPNGNPQLFITGVVVNGQTIETHSAIYLWNQPEGENNHTPAWDVFKIPTPPPN